jgi:hypothetical protein
MGLIVQIDTAGNGRYFLLTIDDGSGVSVEAKIEGKAERREGEDEWKENSQTDDVDVFVENNLPIVHLHGKRLEIGEVVLVKGTLTTFRQERQLVVKRLRRMKDTNEEAIWWSSMAEWKRTILNKPWVISSKDRVKADEKYQEEEQKSKDEKKREQKRTQRRKEWEERHAVKEETKRSLQEEKMNKNALEGSNILPLPWD